MGLLDDAIREHLDLRRRRGADPTEIERAEREALGPVKRNREAAAPDEPGVFDEATLLDSEPGVDGLGTEQVGSAYNEPDEPIAEDLVDEDPPFIEFAGEAPLIDDDAATRLMRTVDVSEPSDATSEYAVEDAFVADDSHAASDDESPPAAAEEDVLEETPEFLQDTPDHDRLWFEQRPPRDFDFDG